MGKSKVEESPLVKKKKKQVQGRQKEYHSVKKRKKLHY